MVTDQALTKLSTTRATPASNHHQRTYYGLTMLKLAAIAFVLYLIALIFLLRFMAVVCRRDTDPED